MKNINRWTSPQQDLLKQNYGKISVAELCVLLDKTDSAIYSKVHYLRKRGWTFK